MCGQRLLRQAPIWEPWIVKSFIITGNKNFAVCPHVYDRFASFLWCLKDCEPTLKITETRREKKRLLILEILEIGYSIV